jgi:hypothetical protein
MPEPVYKYKSVRNVDWDRVPKVEGRLTEKGSHDIEGKERGYIVVDSGPVLFRVYESADLADCFKAAEVGDHVSIEYIETVSLKKTGRKLRRFASSVSTEPKVE